MLSASLSFVLLSAGAWSWHVALLWRQWAANVSDTRNFGFDQNLVSAYLSLFADWVTRVHIAIVKSDDLSLRSASFLFNSNIRWLKPNFAFRTSNWPGAPLVPLVGGLALLTAAMFPGPGSDSVHVTGGQHISVRRLLRSTGGPLWFVTEKFLGVDLFWEGDWNLFNDFFDVLVSWSSSYVRVGLSEGGAVLAWGSVVDAAGVTDP